MKSTNQIAAAFQKAVLSYRQGQLDEAERLCLSIARGPAPPPPALQMLGVIQMRKGKPQLAITWFDKLLKLRPNMPDVWSNRGFALQDLGKTDEALASYERALKLKPDYAEAINNRAQLLFSRKRFDEAASGYARLMQLDPTRPYASGGLLAARLGQCDWTDIDQLSAAVQKRIERGEPGDDPVQFTWHCQSPALQLRCAELYAAREKPMPRPGLPAVPRRNHDRIRLAYLSSDFREHPISYMFVNLFERHDRGRFEVSAFSFGPDDGGTMRARLQRAFDRFTDVRDRRSSEIARLIREHEIDILVDLVGFTAGNRAGILAWRPAPVQVNFQGFGLGAPFIDYVFSDAETTPDRLLPFYREKVVRLPDTWVSTDAEQAIAETTPSRTEERLPEQGFVFCSFNTAYKITPTMFDVWMRLLREVEGSVLWLRQDNDLATANLRRAAQSLGVAPERLVFARRVDLDVHLARHRVADLFIDTFPYGAHTTASHALWAGLPVLTMRGDSFVSRVSASIVLAMGFPELVTESLEAYEAAALRLARHPDELSNLRARIGRAKDTAALFNGDRHRRHVEAAYATMYQRWQDGLPAANFDVTDATATARR